MATFSLRFNIITKNADRLAMLRARLADFSEPLTQIVKEWARGNRQKFAAARGAEDSGLEQFPGVAWSPLTSRAYQKSKRRNGQPNWLMVATGNLMHALTTLGAFGEYEDEHRAVFGAPLDADAFDAAYYNRQTRNVIFLGRGDRNMIRRNIKDYLTFGADYKQSKNDVSARRAALQDEDYEMRADIADVLGVPLRQVGAV